MSDPTVVEDLQRAKRIMKRGLIVQQAMVLGSPRVIVNEFFNLKLVRGEELRLILRPMLSNTASHVKSLALLEWRQVGT